MKKHIYLTSLFVCLSVMLFAQDLGKYEKKTFFLNGETMPYRILYPDGFDPAKKYPVIFFLHGRGESGNDNEKQLTHGAKLFLRDDIRKNFSAIVIFPQCAENSYWANVDIDTFEQKRFFSFKKGGSPTTAMSLLLELTSAILRESYVDLQRAYVGGLSMGGMGTLELLRRKPNTFAAAFAICGGDNPANASKYKKVPLWLFHGGLDDVVPPLHSFLIFKTLKNMGHEPKFTLYPKANHNSWDAAFAETDLLPWVFSNTKKVR